MSDFFSHQLVINITSWKNMVEAKIKKNGKIVGWILPPTIAHKFVK